MKKYIVFYCHNFGGLGHTKRVSLIINEIIKNFGVFYNVIFLNSGEKQDFLFDSIHGIKIINLPKYEIEDFKIISGEKISIYRKVIFQRLFGVGRVEKLIVEHYPFGRNFLDNEIRFLISSFKRYNNNGAVFSSVRDIFDLDSLNKQNLNLFDRFLIHGDKSIINYDNFFTKNIENKLIYTGYVSGNTALNNQINNSIIISMGGGLDGFEKYILDFIEKIKFLKDIDKYKIIVVLGNLYNEKNLKLLSKYENLNIKVYKFINNLVELKKRSVLSVVMGGYNNLVESLKHKTLSIIYPMLTDNEQPERLKIFSSNCNFIFNGYELSSEDIGNLLLEKKERNLKKSINFDGAYFSASFIMNFKKYSYIKIRATNLCNAKCDMCGVIKRKQLSNNLNNLKKSVFDFYKLGGEVINFTGGEPTIYKGFSELLELSKSLGLITSVSTNGSMPLDTNGLIDYVDISVDGLYDLHDKRRGYIGLFKKMKKNFKKLVDNGIFVHINVTIRRDNIGEIVDIFNFLKNKKVNSIYFGIVSSSPVNDTCHLVPLKEQIERFYKIDKKHIISQTGKIKVIFSPDYTNGDFEDFIKSIQNKNSFPKKKGNNCSFILSKKELRINEGGDISPCCEIDDFYEGIGNINNENLLDIVCSREYENFLNRKHPNISKACLNCKIEI